MRYEEFVRKICGDEWKNNNEEYDGGLGVACIKALIYGAKPTLPDMANHLGVHQDDLYLAFTRLARSGAFNQRWNVKRDKTYLGHLGPEEHDRIWGHVAGVASGFIGV